MSNINGTPRQAARVRGLPQEPGCKVMPGRHHALNSKMIYEAGLKVSCMSGFAVPAPPLAQPDTDLISFAETADAKRNIGAAAPQSREAMEAFCGAVSCPCMSHRGGNGATPILPRAEWERMGCKFAVSPLVLMASAPRAVQQALGARSRSEMPRGARFKAIKNRVGVPDDYERKQRYRSEH